MRSQFQMTNACRDVNALVRACMHLERRPGVISLLAGKPHSSTFPFTSLSFTYRDPADPESETPVELTKEEVEIGLQYSPTVGLTEMLEWTYGLQERVHGRKRGEGWKISIGNGAQDLMYKVCLSTHIASCFHGTLGSGCYRARESG